MPEQNDALNTVGDRMVMFFRGKKGGRSNQIALLLVVFIPKQGGRCKPNSKALSSGGSQSDDLH
jgi:hypothetical protein